LAFGQTSLAAEPDVAFETPCPLLVVAPRYNGSGMQPIGTESHLAALRQALPRQFHNGAGSPAFYRVVHTPDEVRNAFTGMNPRVLYYYGHAELRGGQVCMLMTGSSGEPEPVNALDLKQLMAGHFPHMAYINACKSGAGGWYSVGYQLSPEVPVVIANATTSWSEHAGLSAIALLTATLEHGHDPVIAAHAIDDHVTTRGFEWAMRTIHANYHRWQAAPLTALGPLKPIGLRLNRDRSRERVYNRVAGLVRTDDSRLLTFISYASPGNRLDLSHQQLKDHLEDHANHLAHVSWRNVVVLKS